VLHTQGESQDRAQGFFSWHRYTGVTVYPGVHRGQCTMVVPRVCRYGAYTGVVYTYHGSREATYPGIPHPMYTQVYTTLCTPWGIYHLGTPWAIHLLHPGYTVCAEWCRSPCGIRTVCAEWCPFSRVMRES